MSMLSSLDGIGCQKPAQTRNPAINRLARLSLMHTAVQLAPSPECIISPISP